MIRGVAVAVGLVAVATIVAACMRDGAEPAQLAEDAAPLPAVSETFTCAGAEYGEWSQRIWEGDGEPDLAVVLESVFWGTYHGLAELEAVRLVLERRGWQAGPWKVALFPCSATPHIRPDPGQCIFNARRYAEAEPIVGLLSPNSSWCTEVQLEELERAPGGGIGSVSGSNAWTCLTRWVVKPCAGDDDVYRPSRRALYFRVSVHDGSQAAALADLAAREGWKRVYVLDDGEAYGELIADGFTNAASRVGITVVGRARWDGRDRDYRELMRTVKRARPDAVLLGGLVDENGERLIRDKVAVLGPNDGPVKLLAPDGFLGRYTIVGTRGAAAGMYASAGGLAAELLPKAGREFMAALRPRLSAEQFDEAGDLLVYRAQSAEVLLDAIARSDGTRAGVVAALRETRVRGGLIGGFAFDDYGDSTLRWVTVHRAEGRDFVPYRAIDPDSALVEAALRP